MPCSRRGRPVEAAELSEGLARRAGARGHALEAALQRSGSPPSKERAA